MFWFSLGEQRNAMNRHSLRTLTLPPSGDLTEWSEETRGLWLPLRLDMWMAWTQVGALGKWEETREAEMFTREK